MIHSFQQYLALGKVKKKTPDPEEAHALLKKSEQRIKYIRIKKIDNDTTSFILEDSYEAIRESTQALMSIKGFKPYSHEATISFLKSFYAADFSEEELAIFDRFRLLRNDAVYKATKIMESDARESFGFAVRFIKKIRRLHKEIRNL
ncbi:hypothetical protein HYW21_03535 [Candidatus Woesearchaeota archaeon]|nr:hypothetical protein [Candidatus Woesearchaeota archaeon]